MITTYPSSDEQLLQRFVDRQDEDAFAELVARHESLVRATCQRMLGQGGDPEDAAQATFLVLARNANRLGEKVEAGACVAGWLYRVAVNESLLQLRSARSRRAREQCVARQRPAPSDETADTVACRELQIIIEKELVGLPPELRSPVILFHLEGKNQHAAAEELGLTYATFRRRLEQGRKLLRARLKGRGVVVSMAFLAFYWRSSIAEAAASPFSQVSIAALIAESRNAVQSPTAEKTCLVQPRMRTNPSSIVSTTTWSCAKPFPLALIGLGSSIALLLIGALLALMLPPATSMVVMKDSGGVAHMAPLSPVDARFDVPDVSPGAMAVRSE